MIISLPVVCDPSRFSRSWRLASIGMFLLSASVVNGDAVKITGSARLTIYRGPEQVHKEITVDYDLTSASDKYALRVFQPEESSWYKSIVVSDYLSTYVAIAVTNSPTSTDTNTNRPRGPWANGKVIAGLLPNSEEHYWNAPQALALALLCLQQPERVIDGSELKSGAIPMVIARVAEKTSREVKTDVLRAEDGKVEAIQFFLAPPKSGDAVGERIHHAELKILQREGNIPTKIAFLRWGYMPSGERYVASRYLFDGSAVATVNADVFQMIAYDSATPVTLKDSRFPRSVVRLHPNEPPPLTGSKSYQRLLALVELQAKTEATNRLKRFVIIGLLGLSVVPVGIILFRKKQPKKERNKE